MKKFLIKSKKQMLLVIGVFTLVLMLGTTTYAFFNYTRTGAANTIRVGRISFVTRQTKTISLNNLFPIDSTNSEEMSDATKVGTVEIEIEGDTDYAQGVEYLVSSENTHITTSSGKVIPISLDVSISNLGTENANYFTAREDKNATIYKKLVGNELVGDQMLLVGYIKPNTTSGTAEGIQNGKLTIKAYLDKNKILISDTYDGTESDNMGTPNSMASGKTILTTTEWNALQSSGASFQIKVEANEGIWVNDTLDNIIRTKNLNTTTNQPIMDNVASEFVSASTGINFGAVSSGTNGQGIYMRAGTENDAYPIVYYRGAVENNNVIFNNKCWQIVRTTDTGGVKLIYNGEPSEVVRDVNYEREYYSADITNTGVGFVFDATTNEWKSTVEKDNTSSITFSITTAGNYTLNYFNPNGGPFYLKKNTEPLSTTTGKQSIVLNDVTPSDTFTVEYSQYAPESGTVVFSLLKEQITGVGCDNTGDDTQINISGTNKFVFNPDDNSPAYVGYMYGDVYTYNSLAAVSGAYYGSGFTYSNGVYTLTNPSTTQDANHHYSCNSTNAEGTCATIRYYYLVKSYINLTGGEGVEQALAKMNTNTNNSNAKTQIDTWYASNMNTVTSKLEDTIWCNDRSIGAANGWSPTGNLKISSNYKDDYLLYGTCQRSNSASSTSTVKNQPSLSCPNINDAFTVSNGKGNGKLTYPVALLTEDEIVLAGGLAEGQSTFYLNNGNNYWSLSPYGFLGDDANEFYVGDGHTAFMSVDYSYGLRPSVSLKPGMPVVSGIGTVTNPYVIG